MCVVISVVVFVVVVVVYFFHLPTPVTSLREGEGKIFIFTSSRKKYWVLLVVDRYRYEETERRVRVVERGNHNGWGVRTLLM